MINQPNKTIKAVGVIIINKDKKVLIAKRKPDKPMPNKWEFPGGKLEANETLKECGIREIKEELDLDILIDKYIGFEDLEYANKKFRLHIYTAHKVDEEQKLHLNEHTDSAWVNINELVNYDFPAIDLPFVKKIESMAL
ncbi:NUDIX domain-containing protein [Sulfurimonas aquatica]|uniref:8-oxo-dGTP diphosphatase n=1 Tax=Sulfurimonas aquatica TaxID=2672570 RepID=A0A975GDQ5_9BACT|nr:(deoxy)nucleoside triphosphate pyrophosphohydrolase [Sulfurimonas aquatica]QSZ42608.1 NUDIX domain-containing protein [Sulfurimonas aquatica]